MEEYDHQQSGETDKPKRLRKGDIEKLKEKDDEGKDKRIFIWKRSAPSDPLTPFVSATFSRNALELFSEVWKKELVEGKSVLILKGHNLGAYKRILEWINLCVEDGNDVKFPEIEDHEHQLHVLLDVIATANYLKIPEMSLQAHLIKRAPGYARKHLIDLDRVEQIYTEGGTEPAGRELQEIAAISVFEGWWSRKLDDPEYDEYCSFLEQMRIDYPKLDEDLHKQFEKKKAFLQLTREERMRAREGARGEDGKSRGNDPSLGVGDANGWDSGGAGNTVSGDWDTAVATVATVADEGETSWQTDGARDNTANTWQTAKADEASWDTADAGNSWGTATGNSWS